MSGYVWPAFSVTKHKRSRKIISHEALIKIHPILICHISVMYCNILPEREELSGEETVHKAGK